MQKIIKLQSNAMTQIKTRTKIVPTVDGVRVYGEVSYFNGVGFNLVGTFPTKKNAYSFLSSYAEKFARYSYESSKVDGYEDIDGYTVEDFIPHKDDVREILRFGGVAPI